MKIAFIGLGNMGGGMAANLVKAGHEVHAFDLAEPALEKARENGCQTYDSISAAVEGVDAVVSMLPNGKIVSGVYADEVFGKAPKGAVFLDCSTIDVASARDTAEKAGDAGYLMVDAPVSGGIAAAEGGTLTFMVGGSEEGFAKAEPILQAMGKAVIHAGDSGAGQAAKICNNMLLAITMIGTCEAFAMAEKLGLDAQKFYDISSVSSGQSWSMTSYCPVPGAGPSSPADNDYKPGFATALMLKDLTLAMQAAGQAGAKTPLGGLSQELYKAFDEAGNGGTDFSAIIKTL